MKSAHQVERVAQKIVMTNDCHLFICSQNVINGISCENKYFGDFFVGDALLKNRSAHQTRGSCNDNLHCGEWFEESLGCEFDENEKRVV